MGRGQGCCSTSHMDGTAAHKTEACATVEKACERNAGELGHPNGPQTYPSRHRLPQESQVRAPAL